MPLSEAGRARLRTGGRGKGKEATRRPFTEEKSSPRTGKSPSSSPPVIFGAFPPPPCLSLLPPNSESEKLIFIVFRAPVRLLYLSYGNLANGKRCKRCMLHTLCALGAFASFPSLPSLSLGA